MQASSNKQVNLQIWRGLSRTSTPLMLSKFKRSPRCGSECWFRWVNTLLNLPHMFLPNRSSAKPNICPASICHWINSHLIGITEVWTKTKTFCRFLLINYLLSKGKKSRCRKFCSRASSLKLTKAEKHKLLMKGPKRKSTVLHFSAKQIRQWSTDQSGCCNEYYVFTVCSLSYLQILYPMLVCRQYFFSSIASLLTANVMCVSWNQKKYSCPRCDWLPAVQ